MDAEGHPGDDTLQPRDILLRDSFTYGESLLFAALLFLGIISGWIGDADSLVLGGLFIIGGCLSPFLLRVYELSHPFFLHKLYRRLALLTAPAWIGLIIFLAGLLQAPITPAKIDGESYLRLADPNPFFPSTTGPAHTWFVLATFIALHVTAIFAYIVPKARSFAERLLPCLCLNAGLVALAGLAVHMLQPGSGGSGFALYPHGGHWCAFALLWMFVCHAMASRTLRGSGERAFTRTNGPWYLGGTALLGASVIVVEAPRTSGLVLLALAGLAAASARAFLQRREDPHRLILAVVAALAGLAVAAVGAIRLAAGLEDGAGAVRAAALRMFLDRPLFGWGPGSFKDILPFYLSDWHPDAVGLHVPPGFLELPASLGLLGLLPFAVVLFILLRNHFSAQHDFVFSRQLLTGCLAVLALLLVDAPLRSPGLAFNLLLVFFTALRWTEVSRRRPDETDKRPQLVTPASKRKVPFYTGPVKERLR